MEKCFHFQTVNRIMSVQCTDSFTVFIRYRPAQCSILIVGLLIQAKISPLLLLEKVNEISQMMSEVPIPLIWSQLGGIDGGRSGGQRFRIDTLTLGGPAFTLIWPRYLRRIPSTIYYKIYYLVAGTLLGGCILSSKSSLMCTEVFSF